MENGLYMWIRKNKLHLLALSFLIFSCTQIQQKKKNIKIVNFKTIHSGDIVCRLGNGFFSNYFKAYGSTEKKFSHIGIVAIENDSLFVYHSEASEFTGIGFVKRELLSSFLNEINIYDFYRLNFNDSTKSQIIENVKHYFKLKVPFDIDFNSLNDKNLYCSELIATSINKTLNDSIIKPSLILNNKKLYALDDIYLNENIYKIKNPAISLK
jgi:hypothetical protein